MRMAHASPLPILVAFDGEARSGKGTIVQATKDYLRDVLGHTPMLIDRGQVFRVLVIAVTRAGVDVNDAPAVDTFLGDSANTEACVRLVKEVYHMPKEERDGLLYTNDVGRDSAKVGARPLSQVFAYELLKKWCRDAHSEGYDVILLDGRALEEVGQQLEDARLCDFRLSLYFICDGVVGARRTLGYADRSYTALDPVQQRAVDELVEQIAIRNTADQTRESYPLVRPAGVPISVLPVTATAHQNGHRSLYIFDTSADMTKQEMTTPVMELVGRHLAANSQ